MTDDDELFRNDLRRAVATADVDDAWGTIARRVRVQRAGRATARIGIPVVTAALLVGGLVALTQRGGRSGDRPADTSNPAVAVTTTTAAPANTSTASTTPVTSAARPVTDDPSTWAWQTATDNAFGRFDVAAIEPAVGRVCVAVRDAGATSALVDACNGGPFFAVGIVDDRLVAVGVALDDQPVAVRTSTGARTVTSVSVGDLHVYGFALPAKAELTSVDGSLPTACSYRPALAAVAAATDLPRGALRIERCAGDAVYGTLVPSAAAPAGGVVSVLVGADDLGKVGVLDSGTAVCQPRANDSLTGRAAANACALLGLGDDPATATTVASAAWPSAGTATVLGTEVDVRAAEVVDLVCVQARPTDGSDGGHDTCVGGDSFAVVVAGERLTVVGTRATATTVTVRTTQGDVTVPTFPFAGRRVFAAVLPAGEDVVSVGDSGSAAECPYRALYAALVATSSVGPGAGTGMSVERCRNGVAFVGLSSGHDILQGAAGLFERIDGAFRLVNLGSDLCNRTSQPPTAADELAACAKVGL